MLPPWSSGLFLLLLCFHETLAQKCVYDDKGFRTVTCYNISTNYFFDTGLITSKYFYRLFQCVGCHMGEIRQYTFNIKDSKGVPCSFLSMDFADSQVTSLALRSFAGQENLRKLVLRKNLLIKLQPNNFADLKELDRLDLSFNLIEQLPAGAFKGLVHLTGLNLQGNRITSIEPYAFQDLNNLQLLNLVNNSIHSLKEGVFSGLVSVENVLLGLNRIRHLEQGIFESMGYLQKLDLRDNLLQALPEGLDKNKQLKILDVSGNPHIDLIQRRLVSDSLEELRVKYIYLYNVDPMLFNGLPNLHKLELSGNRIRQLNFSMFSNHSKLSSLNISSNQFTNLVVPNSLKLSRLRVLDVSWNLINEFKYDSVFSAMPDLEEFYLTGNLLSCGFYHELQEFFRFEKVVLYPHIWQNCSVHVVPDAAKNVATNNVTTVTCSNNTPKEVVCIYRNNYTMIYVLLSVLIVLVVCVLSFLYKINMNYKHFNMSVTSGRMPLIDL